MPRMDAERIAQCCRFSILSTRMQREIDRELTEEEALPLAWYDVLTELRNAGGEARVHELCEVLDDVPSSLSRRLARMEDEGLLERQPTPREGDRRAVTVSITPAGRSIWRDANVRYRRLVQQYFAQHLTETDLMALQRVWGKLG